MNTTTSESPSYAIICLKWGLIASLITFLGTLTSKFTGLQNDFQEDLGWVSSLGSIVLVVSILYLAIREYRQDNGGYLAYSTGLGISSLTGVIAGLGGGLFNYIYMTFIDQGVMERQMELVREKWEEQGLSASQIAQAEKMTSFMMGPGFQFVTVVLVTLLFYFIFGLIVSGILKKEKSIFE